MPIGVPRRAPATPRALLLDRAPAGVSPVLAAVVEDGAILLTSSAGDLTVQVPLDDADAALRGGGTATAVSVVCTLDTALARRLFRRVSAWRTDDEGRLTTRVRASS